MVLKLLVGISSYFFVDFFVRGQVQMMCLVWQFSLVYLTLILLQLKMGRLHEHDDISNNVSNFSFQNFVWAAGRCFLFICSALWKHRIFTLLTTLISFNKGKTRVDSLPNIYHVLAINLENAKTRKGGDKCLLKNSCIELFVNKFGAQFYPMVMVKLKI